MRGIVILTMVVALAACHRQAPAARSAKTGVKILVFGIDGATWDAVDPLIKQGRMPNLARLVKQGVRAQLTSLTPPFSPAIWTTLATCKRPTKHGITDFNSTRADLKARRIWEVIAAERFPVGVMGWLITWPPDAVDGFFVPDWLARGNDTLPADLGFLLGWKREGKPLDLEAARRFGVTDASQKQWLKYLSEPHPADPDLDMPAYRRAELELDSDIFVHLYRRYQPLFGALVTPAVDHLSHLFWKEYVGGGESRFAQAVPDAYSEADRALGKLLAAVDGNTAVIVLSDHGFKAVTRPTLWEIDVSALIEDLGWKDVRYSKLGERAFLRPQASQRAALAEAFDAARLASSGRKAFTISLPAEGDVLVDLVYTVNRKDAPDVEADREALLIAGKSIPFRRAFKQSRITGTHALQGVLVLHGPPFKRGGELRQASVLDIAPTIMTAAGFPVAEDCDGVILRDAFRPEFLADYPPSFVPGYGPPAPPAAGGEQSPDRNREVLKTLGYL